MGYSNALVAFEKVKIFLDELVKKNGEEAITFEVKDPRLFAYWLRQGIHAAKHNRIKGYEGILGIYEFRELPGKVVATPKEIADNPYAIKMSSAPKTVARLTAKDVKDLRMVVATVIEHKKEPEIEFPDCELEVEDLTKLHNFLTSYEFKIYPLDTSSGILLSKRQLENEWKPQ